MSNVKHKKDIKLTPGANAIKATISMNEKKSALRCNEDTIMRTEIHGIIISHLKEGKEKKEIIDELSHNPRYQKYNMYFENWVTDRMNKIQNVKSKQREGR